MKENSSIIHFNQSLDDDYKLIYYILAKNLGPKQQKEIDKLSYKIMSKIKTHAWQQKFESKNFLFIVDEYSRQNIADIQFLWMTQVIDILFFFEIFKVQHPCLVDSKSFPSDYVFDTKVEKLSEYYYGKKISNANIIRIARNNVVHTGNIDGFDGTIKPSDIKALNLFRKGNNTNSLRPLAISANLLFLDMFLRSLGLDDNDLSFNGLQAKNLNFFKSN